MNYDLKKIEETKESYLTRLFRSGRELLAYLDRKKLSFAIFLVVLGSIVDIITPYLLGTAIDKYISKGDLKGLTTLILVLLVLSLISNAISYFDQNIIGQVGQTALYKLRNSMFKKLQDLPLSFYSQNNTGDLISRLNSDTDKISEFLSQSISQAVGSATMLIGVSVFILYLNFKLGLVLLLSSFVLVIFTRLYSPILEKKNRKSANALGDFSGAVSEQLTNFKAMIVFNKRNVFESTLQKFNKNIYERSLVSNFMAKVLEPIYDSAGNISQIAVLLYGVYLITTGNITIGLLISFITYAVRFYNPLQYFSRLFGEVQTALASWGRIQDLLGLESDLVIEKSDDKKNDAHENLMSFEDVSFGYSESKEEWVLRNINLKIKKNKTYALVGPTGGGKSTTASLMARLYDPISGKIYWKGRDIRIYEREELTNSIGVILQEPFLFSGTVGENIKYGNSKLNDLSDEDLKKLFEEKGYDILIKRFPDGIKTIIEHGGENISIGQRQLISFVRTVLREPEFLILDEATANIDTVTENILQGLIKKLPNETTKVIIAHRLNTIREADDILFIGGGEVKEVSDSEEVLKLLNTASTN